MRLFFSLDLISASDQTRFGQTLDPIEHFIPSQYAQVGGVSGFVGFLKTWSFGNVQSTKVSIFCIFFFI